MDEDILADIPREGDKDPFEDLEKDTLSDSPAEKEPEAEKPAVGDNTPKDENIPFHRHPRWIERENELRTLRERDEAREREIAELREKTERSNTSNAEIPDWFRELYGDNEVAYRKYAEREQEREREIEQRLITRQEQAKQQAIAETTRWSKWIDEQVDSLESEGHTFNRDELLKTMQEFRPTDENNNLDFRAGLKIYEAMHKPDPARSQARKQIADAATKTSPAGDKPARDYMTPNDLRHRSWGNL